MKRILCGIILALAILSFNGMSWAAMITGTLTKIDGSFYVVKDDKGKEQRIHFNDTTKKEGEIKEGAMVTIDEAKGHANSIEVVTKKK
jgi:hypothetical protein